MVFEINVIHFRYSTVPVLMLVVKFNLKKKMNLFLIINDGTHVHASHLASVYIVLYYLIHQHHQTIVEICKLAWQQLQA